MVDLMSEIFRIIMLATICDKLVQILSFSDNVKFYPKNHSNVDQYPIFCFKVKVNKKNCENFPLSRRIHRNWFQLSILYKSWEIKYYVFMVCVMTLTLTFEQYGWKTIGKGSLHFYI